MKHLTRRGFLGLLSGAIAAASTGITTAPSTPAAKRKVHARHIYWYDMEAGMFAHRVDVRLPDTQWGVDMLTSNAKLDAERELRPALAMLGGAIEKYDVEVGQIFTFSVDEWGANKKAQLAWGRIGDENTGRLA
jgi:hypothetical protein